MLSELESAFVSRSDLSRAHAMSSYMKGKFAFYGIPAAERRDIQKRIFNLYKPGSFEELLDLARHFWSRKEREWHYAAIDLLAANKKKWKVELGDSLEFFLKNNAWWDSVDGFTSQVVAPYFKKFPERKSYWIRRWMLSDTMWLRRVSLIHQLKERTNTDTDLLAECILLNADSKEFFIQKAIGWALREYAKVNPEWVLRFLEINELKSLSKREAVKNILQ